MLMFLKNSQQLHLILWCVMLVTLPTSQPTHTCSYVMPPSIWGGHRRRWVLAWASCLRIQSRLVISVICNAENFTHAKIALDGKLRIYSWDGCGSLIHIWFVKEFTNRRLEEDISRKIRRKCNNVILVYLS